MKLNFLLILSFIITFSFAIDSLWVSEIINKEKIIETQINKLESKMTMRYYISVKDIISQSQIHTVLNTTVYLDGKLLVRKENNS